MNLAEIVESSPAAAPAIVSRGEVTTYGQLRDQIAGMRGGLQALGLEPGDRLAIVCGNNWYFVVSYFAALGAGLVAVPLNPTNPAAALTRELRNVGARALVVGPSGRSSAASLDRSELPDLEHVIACQGVDVGSSVALDELVGSEGVPIVERDSDDLAVLLFTSGTAGTPKAAMLTHGNLATNLAQIAAHGERGQTSDDVVFGVLPFFHIFGLNVVLAYTFKTGGSIVLVERFDPSSAIDLIRDQGVTVLTGPPTLWAALTQVPGVDHEAVASIRLAASGAAKLPVETAETVAHKLGIHISEGYGLTESGPVLATSHGTDAPFGSIGVPVPGIEMRLVDSDGSDVLVGDTGEIWAKGPNIFAGYWNDADATATALSDGWLRTGDLAVVDDYGYLYLVDRAKDLIIVSGFNVFPAEVEEVLIDHPRIDAVAVVGVPHPYTGEAVKAYAVVSGGAVEEDDVVAFCAERLPSYKCPDKVEFVDELPRGVGGKILRRELR